ncbi:hypothetical protein N0V90_005690 [Kalmusia sp. IMI 367209]|nr:hypothetical protein N0V90_005690 [Kalmusia sp. IMI 367209]
MCFRLWRFARGPNKNTAVEFEEWFQNVIQDDIRNYFLAYFKEGNEIWGPLYTKTDRKYFNKRIASLVTTSDDHIPLNSIIGKLLQAHPSKADIIQSITPTLKQLIVAYASFPFLTPVVLTKDALCRAILLLTERGWCCWRQGKGTSIRSRSDDKQLSFLYSALVCPPAGAPTQSDVLDVVCRVRYPCDVHQGTILNGLNYLQRHPDTDFIPLAERLQPVQDAQSLDPLPVSQIQLLYTITVAFTPPWFKEPVPPGFEDSESINEEQFITWAKEARLLLCLHRLFEVFLPPLK